MNRTRCSLSLYVGSAAQLSLFLLALPVSAQTIGVNFKGIALSDTSPLNGGNYAPPDTMGAVGPNHIVEFINGGYQIYDKTGAAIGSLKTDTQFWSAAGISGSTLANGLSDTRIIYDADSQRWFASEITTSST